MHTFILKLQWDSALGLVYTAEGTVQLCMLLFSVSGKVKLLRGYQVCISLILQCVYVCVCVCVLELEVIHLFTILNIH